MGTGLEIATVAGLLFFPVLGDLRPDLVSFLPSMRQYAGNWASAMWAFAPGCEQELNACITKAALMQKDPLGEFSCNAIVGFNFGDGHLHDQSLIRAIQRRCQFAPSRRSQGR